MSIEAYERQMLLADVDATVAEEQITAGRVRPAREAAQELMVYSVVVTDEKPAIWIPF